MILKGWYSGFMGKNEGIKALAFGVIVIVVLGITGYLIFSTISTNVKSVTGGPVHWHADFEIYSCGEKVDLIDPKGWDNKVGTPLLHEHNDGRIHVEGPVMNFADISLGNFFNVVGGLPLEKQGECNGQPAILQAFVYQTEGNTFSQQKLEDFTNYVLSNYSKVPPGDCIIIEFGPIKDRTDKLCNFYKTAVDKGEFSER